MIRPCKSMGLQNPRLRISTYLTPTSANGLATRQVTQCYAMLYLPPLKVMADSSLLNTAEAADFLRVSEASVRRWSDTGLLPALRVGRRRERRFARADLVRFLGQPSASTVTIGGVSIPVRTHLAPIYSTDLGSLRLSVPFLAEGLKAGQPCFLEASGAVLERYAKALTKEHGIDFAAAEQSGQLVTLSGPGADASHAIRYWERILAKTLDRGPTLLRVVGEMACARQTFASEAEMMAYEEAYDLMIRRFPAVTLCQYDAREFKGEIVLRVLKAHPDMFDHNLGGFLN